MYNRYIRNDDGVYTRIPEEDPHRPQKEPPVSHNRQSQQNQAPVGGSSLFSAPARITDSLSGLLRQLLDQFHLEHVDTGDLLLLALLFFLFREDADDELLAALGLLLIL